MVEKIAVVPHFIYENGVWNINIDTLVLPESFIVQERKLLYIPASEHGGNHSHPRQEIFITAHRCMYILWQDAEGVSHREAMVGANGEYYMFYVHGHTPHAIVNEGTDPVLLLELANGALTEVMPANLISA